MANGLPRQLFHMTGLVFIFCFITTYGISEGLRIHLQHPWRHIVQSMLESALISGLFFVWRRAEHRFVSRMQLAAINRRECAVDIRNQLQLIMYECGDNQNIKEAVRSIDYTITKCL